jgi:micrococcal nuclease
MKQEYVYSAKVINVVDGDTIDAEVDLGFYVYQRMRLRLAFIDTPEMNDKDPEKRAKAREAKDYVSDLLLGANVVLRTHKKDKYGRFLAEVFVSDKSINEHLIEKGLAVRYG